MHYIDNTAIMQVESNTKLKRNKWTSKRFHLIRKHICTQHTHTNTHTHVYTYRAWKWTNNHQRPKMKIKDKKAERQQHQNGICINSMKYKYTQISFTRLVQRQWFLCKWMLVDWFSSARSLFCSAILAHMEHVPLFTVCYLFLLRLNRSHPRFCILYLNYFMLSVVLVCFGTVPIT